MATWFVCGFDWKRFRALAAELKAAMQSREPNAVRDPEASRLLASLPPEMDRNTACNHVIGNLCGRGEDLAFHGNFAPLVSRMASEVEGEEASLLLSRAAFAGLNIEDWFRAERGLMGILTWSDVERLVASLEAFLLAHGTAQPRRGLARVADAFRARETDDELLRQLLQLARQMRDEGFGLAVFLTET